MGRRELTSSGFTLASTSLSWRDAPFLLFAPSSGTAPSEGRADAITACSRVLIFSFIFSRPNAINTPPKTPNRRESAKFRGIFGSAGRRGGLAGATIQMLLAFKLAQ